MKFRLMPPGLTGTLDYHWFRPVQSRGARTTFEEAKLWCYDQFGTDLERWFPGDDHAQMHIYIRDEADATAFKIRWG